MNTFIITQLSDPIAHLLGDWSRELNPGSVLLRIVIVVVLSAIIGCERSANGIQRDCALLS